MSSHFLRRITSYMIRKGEHEIALHDALIRLSYEHQRGGEFCQSRIDIYRNLTSQFIIINRRSSIQSSSLSAIFYARFFTLSSLAKQHQKLDVQLDQCLQQHPPNKSYQKMVDAEIHKTLKMQAAKLEHYDAYQQSIVDHFQNRQMAERYLAIEEALMNELESPRLIEHFSNPHLRDQFNAFNHQTMPYVRRATERDVLYTTPSSTRTFNFLKTFATPIMVSMTLLPVQQLWSSVLPPTH